jgi:hypothetical protein
MHNSAVPPSFLFSKDIKYLGAGKFGKGDENVDFSIEFLLSQNYNDTDNSNTHSRNYYFFYSLYIYLYFKYIIFRQPAI